MSGKTEKNKDNIIKLLAKLDETNAVLKSRLKHLDSQLKTISDHIVYLNEKQLENYNELLDSTYTNVLIIKNIMDEYMLNPQRLEQSFSNSNKTPNKDLTSLSFDLQHEYDKYTNFLLEYNTKYKELSKLISSKLLSNSLTYTTDSKPKPILKHHHTRTKEKQSSHKQDKPVRCKSKRD